VRIYSSGLVPPSAAGAAIIIGDCVLLVLAIVWTVLRVILRQRTAAGLLVEDYLHLFALVWTLPYLTVSRSANFGYRSASTDP
jgi:hypothetical protein